MSTAQLKRLILRFERAADKNQQQRAKFTDDPAKCVQLDPICDSDTVLTHTRCRFIDSEADLDIAIKSLLPLAQVPTRAYPELAQGGGAARLAGLLSHENADIALEVVSVLHELTDEETGDDMEDDEDDEVTRDEALRVLVDALVSRRLLYGVCERSLILPP